MIYSHVFYFSAGALVCPEIVFILDSSPRYKL